jgi:hypothetical protein
MSGNHADLFNPWHELNAEGIRSLMDLDRKLTALGCPDLAEKAIDIRALLKRRAPVIDWNAQRTYVREGP